MLFKFSGVFKNLNIYYANAVTWREEIGARNAEMSTLPRRDRARFRCVLRPSLAYRKSRAASRLQFLPSRFAKRSVPLSFVAKKEKTENKTLALEKHANGTAESGVFFLPSSRRGEKCASRNYRSFHLSHSDTLKLTRSKLQNWYFEILSRKVIRMSVEDIFIFVYLSSCNSESNSHREAPSCRSSHTRQMRCRGDPSNPSLVAAALSSRFN